jgi:hypothetical protein
MRIEAPLTNLFSAFMRIRYVPSCRTAAVRRRDIKWRTNHAPFERRRLKRFFYFQIIYCVRATYLQKRGAGAAALISTC